MAGRPLRRGLAGAQRARLRRVALRRGRASRDYTIRELPPAQSGLILQRYIRIAPATRPYVQAGTDSPAADFIAEADRHPVFELTPAGEDAAP